MDFIVTTLADNTVPPPGSLREAILLANAQPLGPADRILFSPAIIPGTILLAAPLPPISDPNPLQIIGPGATQLFIDGANLYGPIFTITVTANVAISGLTIQNGLAASGAGVLNQGTLRLVQVLIRNNVSTGGVGGGVNNDTSGILSVSDSTISGNQAIFGGGLFNAGTLTITNTTVADNRSSRSGGGLVNVNLVTITRSTFSGNQAGTFGGGISNGGPMTIVNSTISGNSAVLPGGGIHSQQDPPAIAIVAVSFTTIANNTTAAAAGGGIDNTTSVFRIKNDILASNGPDNCSGVIAADGVNFSTDASCPAGPAVQVVSAAALNLGPLALNPPGTTATHALLPGSVAINAAPDCTDAIGLPVTTDQRGVPRPQGSACDSGSYEFVFPTPPPPPPPPPRRRVSPPPRPLFSNWGTCACPRIQRPFMPRPR
jgi:CSLREA domain-containing protein